MNLVTLDIEPQALEGNAERAAELMKSMSNKWRLLVLCSLVHGEKSVGELERKIGIGQSALSQHLAVLRRKKLVATRRSAQTIYYSLAGREVALLLTTLYGIYCGSDADRCGIDAAGI